MRVLASALLVAALIACGGDSAETVCRKDARRWGECVGELEREMGAEVQRVLETRVAKCIKSASEVSLAMSCAEKTSCDGWMECYARAGRRRY